MANENAGTEAPVGEAQTDESTAPAAGTPPQADEVTTLRSRNAGLDAKVTSLSTTVKEALARAEAAEARALALASDKENGDQELRAQLAQEKATNASLASEAKVAKIAAAFPETYDVLGDAVASMTADQLAAAEARFKGVAGESHTPPPVGNNAARPPAAGAKSLEDMTLPEAKEYAKSAFAGLTWEDIAQP